MDGLNAVGYQQLTVSTGAVPLVLPTATRPKRALILCGPLNAATTNYVRWRADGTNPTSTVGMPLPVGDYLDLTFEDGFDFFGILGTIKFIRDSGAAADATLEITYFS